MKIARIAVILLLGMMLVSGLACGGDGEPTPAPTPTPTPTPTSTPTSTPPTVGTYQHVLWLCGYLPDWGHAINMLQAEGYNVLDCGDRGIYRSLLADYGILFIGDLDDDRLSDNEMALIVDWIKAGGSALFAIQDNRPYDDNRANYNSMLLPLYGIQINDDDVEDNTHLWSEWGIRGISTSVIFEHPTTRSVSLLKFIDAEYKYLPSLTITHDNTQVIVQGEPDAYSEYYSYNPPLAAAAEHMGGRVIVVTGSHQHSFEDSHIGRANNQLFFWNIIEWLSHK